MQVEIYIFQVKNKEYFNTSIIDPDNKNTTLSIVNIENMALATSGNYERYFIENDKYISHILKA